jgi:hypothetical protein
MTVYSRKTGKAVFSAPFQQVWIGGKGVDRGNTLLFKLASPRSGYHYAWVGSEVKLFNLEPRDSVKQFYSPVGNSDVPYPVVVGNTHAYFVDNAKTVSLDSFDSLKTSELQTQFYASRGGLGKRMRSRVVVKRAFP